MGEGKEKKEGSNIIAELWYIVEQFLKPQC